MSAHLSNVCFEQLENRQLLSATIVNDKLVVRTGGGNDTILIYSKNNGSHIGVLENDLAFEFTSSGVNSIEVLTGAGNDYIWLHGTQVAGFPTKSLLVGGAGNDTIIGGNWSDAMWGDDLTPQLGGVSTGTPGNDSLVGGASRDSLIGNEGNDTLKGEAGDDYMTGWGGDDRFEGGPGRDFMEGNDGSDYFDAGSYNDGQDLMYGGGDTPTRRYNDYIDYSKRTRGVLINPSYTAGGGDGEVGENDHVQDFEYYFGGFGNDTLAGTDGQYEQFKGNDGNDLIYGNGGVDWIFGNKGADSLYGGQGNDFVYGNDIIVAPDTGDNMLFGEGGDDLVSGTNRNDTIHGGLGLDQTSYGDRKTRVDIYLNGFTTSGEIAIGEKDRLISMEWVGGGAGNDYIIGSDKDERLYGGPAGNDFIYGFGGRDLLSASNSGNCNLIGGDGDDIIDGYGGQDANGGGRDTLDGGRGNDLLRGYKGDDTLSGGEGNDTLEGGDGNDTLTGDAGNDTLRGQNGNDTLYANDGVKDVLVGGAGTDKYRADLVDQLSELETRI
jgi:Ca2+-binding RTX toxin-like protein